MHVCMYVCMYVYVYVYVYEMERGGSTNRGCWRILWEILFGNGYRQYTNKASGKHKQRSEESTVSRDHCPTETIKRFETHNPLKNDGPVIHLRILNGCIQ